MRQRAREFYDKPPRAVATPSFVKSECPTERKAHLEYAIKVVRELLAAAPDDVFTTRYKRWLSVMEDDLADEEAKDTNASTFRGSVDVFQRQPKDRKARVSV